MTTQTEAPDRHLREFELADYLDGTLDADTEKQVRQHLDVCAACSELSNAAAFSVPSVPHPATATLGPALPEILRQALESRAFASPDEGQLWRLRAPGESGEIAALGAIVRREADHVWVVPVTPDSQEATDLWAAQLRVANTDLVMAFWTSLATPVGYEVLDVWLGWADVLPLKQLLGAQRRGEEPPRGMQLGRPLDEELTAYRADLSVEFMQLQEARLIPDTPEDEASVDVIAELTRHAWTPSKLKAVTGDLTSGQAGDVLSGSRQLTPEHLLRVSAALGQDLTGVPNVTSAVEWQWTVAVGYPTRRHRYERLAALDSSDPWEYRCGIARDPSAVAARKSEGSAADWDFLAEQQLMALEREAGLA